MSKIADDFLRFLKANFPDDYRKVSVKDVKDDVFNSVWSRREEDYKIWCRIPEWIKNQYRDDLPDEVWNGNLTVRELIKEEEEKKLKEEKESKELLSYGIGLMAVGYSVQSVNVFMKNRAEREKIMCNAKDGMLSKADLDRIIELQNNDRATAIRDIKENQKERYFLYLVKELSRAKKREKRAISPALKTAQQMKIANIEKEFRAVSENLKNEEFRNRLVSFLNRDVGRVRWKHLDKSVAKEVEMLFKEYGIDVDMSSRNIKKMKNYDKDSLSLELKKQYEKRMSAEYLTRDERLDNIVKLVKDKVTPKINLRMMNVNNMTRI